VDLDIAALPRDHLGQPQIPTTPFGRRYPLLVDGGPVRQGRLIAATTHEAAIDALIPGYALSAPDSRRQARYDHAIRVHQDLTSRIAARFAGQLSTDQLQLLLAHPEDLPRDLTVWTVPVPFVVVDLTLIPYTTTPCLAVPNKTPTGTPGPLLVLLAAEEHQYLVSLSEAGWLRFSTPA